MAKQIESELEKNLNVPFEGEDAETLIKWKKRVKFSTDMNIQERVRFLVKSDLVELERLK